MESTSNLLCRLGCIFFGIIAGWLAWFLLSELMSGMFLFIVALLIVLLTAWLLHEALCNGSKTAAVASAAAGTAAVAASASAAKATETAAPAASLVSTPAPKAAAKKPAAKKAAKPAASKKSAKKKSGPVRLNKPKGKADDLKRISGVGPKLEKTLNGLGFWHFSQIADWKRSDVAIVDDELSFKGRIDRDEWIKQAKALAKGK